VKSTFEVFLTINLGLDIFVVKPSYSPVNLRHLLIWNMVRN